MRKVLCSFLLAMLAIGICGSVDAQTTTRKLKVTWANPPVTEAAPAATENKVEVSSGNQTTWVAGCTATGTETTCTTGNVNTGALHYVRVTRCNTAGCSAATTPFLVNLNVPGPATGISVEVILTVPMAPAQ